MRQMKLVDIYSACAQLLSEKVNAGDNSPVLAFITIEGKTYPVTGINLHYIDDEGTADAKRLFSISFQGVSDDTEL